MPVEVILPKVDMDMATGQIARWFVAEGDHVKKGDTLFEIETDKAAMDIDAPAGGIIRDITGKERVDIPVGQAVAWIYAEGEESAGGPAAPAPSVRASEAPSEGAVGVAALDNLSPMPSDGGNPTRPSDPRADPLLNGEGAVGSVRATPLARRLAREARLDLASIAGSGPNGRVLKADIEAAMKTVTRSGELASSFNSPAEASPPLTPHIKGEGSANVSVSPSPLREGVSGGDTLENGADSEPALKLFQPGSYDLVPHDAMRRTIARRLVEAKTTIPHFYLSLDCEIDALLSLRVELNATAPMRDGQPAFRLSVNDMVIKAWALALRDVPDANVSWTEANLVRHSHIDVGVAVSVPGGLITPIIRGADGKTLSTVSNEMRDLAGRASSRKLRADEYQGGTTSVSNLGMFGITDFAAVINPPHATILAVGAGAARGVVRNGEVVAATLMSVTLSADHRAIDGARAAELLAAFKRIIENPLRMLV